METQELIRRRAAAFAKRKAGDYSAALEEFEHLEALSSHPRDIATLRFFQTTILTDMCRIDDALDRFAKVDRTVLAPIDQIDYVFESARLKRAEGRIAEALELTEKALKATTQIGKEYDVRGLASSLRTLKGVLLSESGRCDDAIPILEEAPVEEEGWAEAKIRLGDCNLKRERYRKESIATLASHRARRGSIPFIVRLRFET
jgi:tetratricopeptide (TPR) repeat protein